MFVNLLVLQGKPLQGVRTDAESLRGKVMLPPAMQQKGEEFDNRLGQFRLAGPGQQLVSLEAGLLSRVADLFTGRLQRFQQGSRIVVQRQLR